ncbi:STAS domain-containing protein [Streptomyces monomycini]|uniref:STAS domain-containing protein n=1 Tax=Streptomyces monomycini TaxID=371720 RepID=UPI0004AADDD5|nr:STAS domain-containing protein [Streptomyces monomycini]
MRRPALPEGLWPGTACACRHLAARAVTATAALGLGLAGVPAHWVCAGRRPDAPRWFALAAWHDATDRGICARARAALNRTAQTNSAPTAGSRALPDGSWETVECLAAMIRHHATVPTVIVDISSVERLNIDTLAILVRKAMRLRSAGGELLLAGPAPAVRKLIERTGTGCLLHTSPGWAAAVGHLARDGRTWHPVSLADGPGALFTDLLEAPCRT